MNLFLRVTLCGAMAMWAAVAPAQVSAEAKAPVLHLLVIGVNDYSDVDSVASLEGAVNDARAFARVFAAKFGGDVERHHLLDRAAIGDSIADAIRTISRTALKDDLFVFLFSGWGYHDSAGAYLLLPDGSRIRARDLRTWLNVMPAGNQLIILDAPFSGDLFRAFRTLDLNQRTEEAGTLIANVAAITVDGIASEETTQYGTMGVLTLATILALEGPKSPSMSSLSAELARIFDSRRGEKNGPLLIHRAGSDFPLTAAGLRDLALASQDSAARAADPRSPPPAATRLPFATRLPAATRSREELFVDSTATTVALAVRVGELPAGATVHVNGRLATLSGQTARVNLPLSDAGPELRVRVTRPGAPPRESTISFSAFRDGLGGAGPVPAAATNAAALRPRSVALLFATNEYDNERGLRNPIFDAEAIATELGERYGFEVHLVRNATRKQMRDSLVFYSQRGDAVNDQLLVFFAGHGSYDQSRIMDGYIVARDTKKTADDEDRDTAVQYNWVRRLLAKATSRHVLLMLDVCYGGSFIDRVSESATRETEDDPMYRSVDLATHMERTSARKTRQYLTAGGIERVPDGRPGEHSPFARRFLEALRTYGGSRGFLTLKDLHATIQTVNPEPRAGGFEEDDPGSDFVFVAKR